MHISPVCSPRQSFSVGFFLGLAVSCLPEDACVDVIAYFVKLYRLAVNTILFY